MLVRIVNTLPRRTGDLFVTESLGTLPDTDQQRPDGVVILRTKMKENEMKEYSNAYLAEKIDKEYKQSKAIRKDLEGAFEVFIKDLKDYDKEYDPGVDGIFAPRDSLQGLEEYTNDIKENLSNKKSPWDFALENAVLGWEMKRAYYSYKEHKKALEKNLDEMNYSYYD